MAAYFPDTNEGSMRKDSKTENEWFAQHEEELLRQARRKRERERQEAGAAAARAAQPKCPKCGHEMKEEEIGEVTIDRCTSCEGIYLDRGELETLLLGESRQRRGFFRSLLGFGPD
jgi:hypothetical protein